MRRVLAILGSAVFFVLAPVTVAGLAPWWITGWHVETRWLPLQIVGGLFVVAGTLVLLDSFVRFALQGLGTPAPVFPTRDLVVTGLYRYVRNPMYVAVVAVIAGQSLIFGSDRLLGYATVVFLGFYLFVLLYEEPTLRATFGPAYDDFCEAVPRWIPRLTPWQGRG